MKEKTQIRRIREVGMQHPRRCSAQASDPVLQSRRECRRLCSHCNTRRTKSWRTTTTNANLLFPKTHTHTQAHKAHKPGRVKKRKQVRVQHAPEIVCRHLLHPLHQRARKPRRHAVKTRAQQLPRRLVARPFAIHVREPLKKIRMGLAFKII
jgi:hypothetical protein